MQFSAKSGDKFEQVQPGSYAAVCVRVIDMGTQEVTWQGTTKFQHKVKFVWELDEKMTDGRPYITSRDFTVSLHEKATLRAFLAGWRGRDFTPEELGGFDPKNLVGAPCLLSLVQNGDYVNVASASKLPKGMESPKPASATVYFSLSSFDQKEFDKLSDKIKDKIKKSPEYIDLFRDDSSAAKGSFADMEDSLPF